MIYFAQPKNGGPIRIGASSAVTSRLRTMGTWLPGGVETIAELDGLFLGEAILHRCFDPIRVERDWFRSCREIWRFILDIEKGRPHWLPDIEADAPRFDEEDLFREFGGRDAALNALGYSNLMAFNQGVRTTSKLGYSFASRVIFARLLRDGALPDYIEALHGDRIVRQAA